MCLSELSPVTGTWPVSRTVANGLKPFPSFASCRFIALFQLQIHSPASCHGTFQKIYKKAAWIRTCPELLLWVEYRVEREYKQH